MKNIIKQMEKAGVKRIVALGGMGVLDGTGEKLVMDEEDFPAQYNAVSQEHKKALEALQNSNLDWTFVCPPTIEPGEPTGIFQATGDRLPEPNNLKISSGDLALFMLKELEQNLFVKQKVGISS